MKGNYFSPVCSHAYESHWPSPTGLAPTPSSPLTLPARPQAHCTPKVGSAGVLASVEPLSLTTCSCRLRRTPQKRASHWKRSGHSWASGLELSLSHPPWGVPWQPCPGSLWRQRWESTGHPQGHLWKQRARKTTWTQGHSPNSRTLSYLQSSECRDLKSHIGLLPILSVPDSWLGCPFRSEGCLLRQI